MKVLAVCVGTARQLDIGGQQFLTAIGKQPAQGSVPVRRRGLEGDEQVDSSRHGGLSKAVYAYPAAHLPFWQTVRAQARVAGWDEPVPPGLMGENLLLQGVDETMLHVGDRLVLPHCVLAVSEPRFPCATFSAAMGFAQAGKLMVQSGFCGSYLGVLEEGHVQAGDEFVLQPGPRDVAIRDLFKARARG